MRRLAAAFVLLCAVIARGQDSSSAGTPLPIDRFADAKEGDWLVLAGSVLGESSGKPLRRFVRYGVAKVAKDEVALEVRLGVRADEPGSRIVLGRTRTLEQLLPSELELSRLRDARVEDAERVVADRKLACKKVTASARRPFIGTRGEDVRVSVWLSADVKAPGIVAIEVTCADDPKARARFEVAGWGNGDRAAWGKTPEQLSSRE